MREITWPPYDKNGKAPKFVTYFALLRASLRATDPKTGSPLVPISTDPDRIHSAIAISKAFIAAADPENENRPNPAGAVMVLEDTAARLLLETAWKGMKEHWIPAADAEIVELFDEFMHGKTDQGKEIEAPHVKTYSAEEWKAVVAQRAQPAPAA